jgi:hypothetical protein
MFSQQSHVRIGAICIVGLIASQMQCTRAAVHRAAAVGGGTH